MICRRCERDLPRGEFDPSRQQPERLKTFCRGCRKELSDISTKASHERWLARGGVQSNRGHHYADRQRNLLALGFKRYRAYLKSDLWKSIRERVFAAKGIACYLCGGRATQAHHNRYAIEDLRGDTIKKIHPICDACHRDIEFNGEEKNTVSQAKMAFNRKRKAVR